jgi:hypothetical protein
MDGLSMQSEALRCSDRILVLALGFRCRVLWRCDASKLLRFQASQAQRPSLRPRAYLSESRWEEAHLVHAAKAFDMTPRRLIR